MQVIRIKMSLAPIKITKEGVLVLVCHFFVKREVLRQFVVLNCCGARLIIAQLNRVVLEQVAFRCLFIAAGQKFID